MTSRITYTLAASLLLAAGVFGRWLQYRRDYSTAVQQAVVRLENVPMQFGSWVGQDIPMDDLILRVANCAGYRNRRYTDLRTGRTVDVGIMVGLPGPMAEHTPEVCLPALGYHLVKKSLALVPLSEVLGSPAKGELARMEFVNARERFPLQVWQSWFDGSHWSRPSFSRLAFANREVLYRLQVASTLSPDPFGKGPTQMIDPAADFLRDSLPMLTSVFEGKEPNTTDK